MRVGVELLAKKGSSSERPGLRLWKRKAAPCPGGSSAPPLTRALRGGPSTLPAEKPNGDPRLCVIPSPPPCSAQLSYAELSEHVLDGPAGHCCGRPRQILDSPADPAGPPLQPEEAVLGDPGVPHRPPVLSVTAGAGNVPLPPRAVDVPRSLALTQS